MAETPEERLARLRREVESSWTPPAVPSTGGGPATDRGPSASAPPASSPTASPAALTPPVPPSVPAPVPPSVPAPVTAPTQDPAPPDDADDGWSLREAIGGPGVGGPIAIGLVALGGYLLLALFVPSIAFGGSLVMVVAGIMLLWLHLGHRAGAWALYAGAVLVAVGALRVLAGLMPFTVEGETSLGIGIGLLAIGHLRHTQAGGYGWQGRVGVVALAWGGLQFLLGLLPGSPGPLDLVVPVLIVAAGVLLLARRTGSRSA